MNDERSVLKQVTSQLESAGIPYMVTGSMALNVYAQPRMTRDVDVVIELRPAEADRFVALFSADFDCDLDRVRNALTRRTMFNLIHTRAIVKIDFILRKDTPYREAEFQRRRSVAVDGVPMWVVAPEDLILSKLDWARDSRSEMQLRDVKQIVDAQPSLDWNYLRAWAVRLGVQDLLDEARS